MAAPEYDFFATGPRPKPAAPTNDRFGVPSVPSTPQPPLPQRFAPEGAGPVVNQFGLPVDEARPTGPLAAPGYGTVPVHNSLAAGYDDVPSVWDPAAAMGTRAHSRALPPSDTRPGAVRAAGIIAVVLGVLTTLVAGSILLAYSGLKSQLDSELSARGADAQAIEALASTVMTGVLVVGLLAALEAVLYLVLGVCTIQGRRWAAWSLVVLSGLAAAASLWQTVGLAADPTTVGSGLFNWLGVGVTIAVVLLLTLGEGGRWLRRSQS